MMVISLVCISHRHILESGFGTHPVGTGADGPSGDKRAQHDLTILVS